MPGLYDVIRRNRGIPQWLFWKIAKNKNIIPELTALLEDEDDPNLQDDNGKTPLHYVCGNFAGLVLCNDKRNIYKVEILREIILILLDRGADPNLEAENGNTPLEDIGHARSARAYKTPTAKSNIAIVYEIENRMLNRDKI